MTHDFDNGNYQAFAPSDIAPKEMHSPLFRWNLCLRCGVRVWTRDIAIHNEWHDFISAVRATTEGATS